MAELFGFSITRSKKTADPKQRLTQPQADDGTQTIAAGDILVNTLTWKVKPRQSKI